MENYKAIARGALFVLGAAAFLHADNSIRVNAGGPAYTDGAGHIWSADSAFIGGGTYATTAAIANTTTPVLYQTEHYGNGATLEYKAPVNNGLCAVTLKFAEIWYAAAGQRVFNIVINGATVQSNFDPFAAAGGANIAVDKIYQVAVTNGAIDIQFVPVVSNPKVSAIEIDPPASPNFADAEKPAGAVNGSNVSFTLAHTPNPAGSVLLLRNGLLLTPGMDFSLSGSTISFPAANVPQTGDTMLAWYRY